MTSRVERDVTAASVCVVLLPLVYWPSRAVMLIRANLLFLPALGAVTPPQPPDAVSIFK